MTTNNRVGCSASQALVTSNALRRRAISKRQISKEGTYGHRQHDPSVVCHKEEPGGHSERCHLSVLGNLHDEEAVEDLNGVVASFHQLGPSLCHGGVSYQTR